VNKSGKKQEAAQCLSCNETHLQRTPIDVESTCRLGLCGFRICGNRQLVPSLSRAVQAAFNKTHHGQKLLVLPGRWGPWPIVDEIAGVARDAKLHILFETETKESAPHGVYTAVSHTGKLLPLKLYQRFWNCKNATPERVQILINECNSTGMRVVHLGAFTLGLLICGENNVIANRQADDNRAYVRHDLASKLFRGVRLIFNGAHDKMGEWGKLERRFEFLSKRKRWLFYATNNRGKNWGKSTLRIYYDGCKIATSIGPDSNGAAAAEVNGSISWNVTLKGQGRKYQIPAALVTSNDDRCRILTLDIPGKLLR
jgi:hypothetical protein